MNLPYTLQNRSTGSTDPKYKADADEVMANLEYIFDTIAFCRLEVDVSLTSENKNCDTQNAEYGASITTQCNLTHILGESYGGMFLGKLTGSVAYGDRLGIMDSTGRFWMVRLGHDNQISFADGTGGAIGKCIWERIDTGSAYTGYNDTTWMNTLTIWHISRATTYSNISQKVLKSQLILDQVATEGLDAADIPLVDTGSYFTTDTVEAALAEFGAHKGDSTDPHGSTLTQTNIVVTGWASFAVLAISTELNIGTDKFIVVASTGNTAIGGTLGVSGVTTFGGNVTINPGKTLTVGGALTASTSVATPLIHQDGDLTFEAHSVSAQTNIYLKNPDTIYDAIVHVDKYLQWDRITGTPFSLIQMHPSTTDFYLNIASDSADTVFSVFNASVTYKSSIKVEKGYIWSGIYNFTFNKTSETVMTLDLYNTTADVTLYIGNSAGGFEANVDIDGDFTVHGSKAATVKMDNGESRELYSQESPEVWFEDFGEGRLWNGQAQIELDPLFLQTVTIDSRHRMKVFIQVEGDCNGVYVQKGTTCFDVIELKGGISNASFSYRVVAKRKGYEDIRLTLVG